jgi:hypothetical protein
VLTRPQEKADAYRKLEKRLTQGSHVETHSRIQIQGYAPRYKVYWHPKAEVSFCFNENSATLRHHPFWIGIGLQDPARIHGGKLDSLPTQFNAAHGIGTGTFAGAFLKDSSGRIHLGHTGRLFRTAASKVIAAYPGPKPASVPVNGRPKQFLLLGALDDEDLIVMLREFATFVRTFKSQSDQPGNLRKFIPEFGGTAHVPARKAYQADYEHGRVVNALAERLRDAGLRVTRTREIDLIAWDARSRPVAIYEVKSGAQPYDIYTALGQLTLHGHRLPGSTRRIMVLPNAPTRQAARALGELGISIELYKLTDGRPTFQGRMSGRS